MIEIDGSHGEGGGQVLRTALTLSALTGQPLHLHHIRAKRRNPGMAAQHLTVVRALAELCQAEVHGAKLRATELEFRPQSRPQARGPAAKRYTFDVAEAAPGGSAGSVTLILQALLLPLALATVPVKLTLRGGTHVAWSPPFEYLAHVFLPAIAAMGLRANAQLDTWGFYPAGGGQLSVEIANASQPLQPLTLTERGPLQRIWGRATAANLPAHIPQRIANRTRNVLRQNGLTADIQPTRVHSNGPGVGVVIIAEYRHITTGVVAYGKKGKPSEQVANEACRALLAYHTADAPVDKYLADQLLLPAALAGGQTHYHTTEVTQHLLTNAHVIRQFLPAQITINGPTGAPGTITTQGSPLPPS